MVKGDAGWLIADVTPKGPSSGGIPSLTALLKDYVRPSKASVEAAAKSNGPEVVATTSTSSLPHLNKGTHYSQARENLMSFGYKGVKVPDADACDASGSATCFPEMESCAGAGEGNCLYLWEKSGTFVEVSTVGDPPEVASVSRGQKPKP